MNDLSQYPTPLWLAEALVERYFPNLSSRDAVIEPSCGTGPFLCAIPVHVPAIGVEIDPVPAAEARRRSGRSVIVGDFRTVPIPFEPTVVLGNPPFQTTVIDGFMARAHEMLPDDGQVGLVLPAYFFQTASRVVSYSERWCIRHDFIPRNGFHSRMREALVFAVFTKSRKRILVGFALYQEAFEIQSIDRRFRQLLTEGRPYRSAWRAVVEAALEALGGEASLRDIYGLVSGKRPTTNPAWREKVRQIAQIYFCRVGDGRYAIPAAA